MNDHPATHQPQHTPASPAIEVVAEMRKLLSPKWKVRLAFSAYLCRMAARILNQVNGDLLDKKLTDEAMRCRVAWLQLRLALFFIEGKIAQGAKFEECAELKRVMDAIEQGMGDAPHLEKANFPKG